MPPNAPSPQKRFVAVRLPRLTYTRLKKIAKATGATVSDIIIEIITTHVAHVELTSEELKQIAKEIEDAQRN